MIRVRVVHCAVPFGWPHSMSTLHRHSMTSKLCMQLNVIVLASDELRAHLKSAPKPTPALAARSSSDSYSSSSDSDDDSGP